MSNYKSNIVFALTMAFIPTLSSAACDLTGRVETGDMILKMIPSNTGDLPGLSKADVTQPASEGAVIFDRFAQQPFICDQSNWISFGSEIVTEVFKQDYPPDGGVVTELITASDPAWKPQYKGVLEFLVVGAGGGGFSINSGAFGASAGGKCHKRILVSDLNASFDIKIGVGGSITTGAGNAGSDTTVAGPGILVTAQGGGGGGAIQSYGGDCIGADYGFKGGNGKSGTYVYLGAPVDIGYNDWDGTRYNVNSPYQSIAHPNGNGDYYPSSQNPIGNTGWGNGGSSQLPGKIGGGGGGSNTAMTGATSGGSGGDGWVVAMYSNP